MLLAELFNEGTPVELDVNTAEYTKNSEHLTYRVTNLPVESSFGNKVIENAGTIILNITPEMFAERIQEVSGDVQSVDGITLNPLPNFKCNDTQCANTFKMQQPYTLTVDYTTSSGERARTQVTFNNSTFKPSDELSGLTT